MFVVTIEGQHPNLLSSVFWKDSLIQCDIAQIYVEWKLKTKEATTHPWSWPFEPQLNPSSLSSRLHWFPWSMLPHWAWTFSQKLYCPDRRLPLKYQGGPHFWYLQPIWKTMRVENRQAYLIFLWQKIWSPFCDATAKVSLHSHLSTMASQPKPQPTPLRNKASIRAFEGKPMFTSNKALKSLITPSF